MNISIARAEPDFSDWAGLLGLLAAAFRGMEGRIDPPSSLGSMTAESLRDKAAAEVLVLAFEGARLVGSGFGAEVDGALYLSKLAVDEAMRRRGILARIVDVFEAEARARGLSALTLQSRVELVENHAAFAALGFREVGGTRHPGFDRVTSLSFRKDL